MKLLAWLKSAFRPKRYLVRDLMHPQMERWTDERPDPRDTGVEIIRDREQEREAKR